MQSKDKDSFPIFVLAILLLVLALHNFVPVMVQAIIRYKYITAFVVTSIIMGLCLLIRSKAICYSQERELRTRLNRATGADCIQLGQDRRGNPVYMPLAARKMHSQVVGTTNAGKTESVILPWAIDDIKKGRGLILIDGKADRGLLDKLYAYSVKYKRSKDFRLFSLVSPDFSSSFNPLIGGSAYEIAERVFSSLSFEVEYYKNIQYEVLKQTLYLFEKTNTVPTFSKIIQAITNPFAMQMLANKAKDPLLSMWVDQFVKLDKDEREQRTSGLVSQLGHFVSGETAALFNAMESQINVEHAIREGLIVYFQLPVMKTPTLGKATAKMALQCLQSAVSSRHLEPDKNFPFFGVYLDDFTEYLTTNFINLLNKSRSANIGITFAHQAQGDLGALGDEIKNAIQTNSNIKVFMRTNEPESAEYFARLIGTQAGIKTTERQKKTLAGTERTGDGSVRDVEEFLFHPNKFKRDLGVGDAVLVVPFSDGSFATDVKFEMLPDLDVCPLPRIAKLPAANLVIERERRSA
mgnify:CR=1 FL=1